MNMMIIVIQVLSLASLTCASEKKTTIETVQTEHVIESGKLQNVLKNETESAEIPANDTSLKPDIEAGEVLSEVEKESIFEDIKSLVRILNRIISLGRYNDWLTYVDESYFATISSDVFLLNASQSERFRTKNIVLETAKDYFSNVVMPSRMNIKVDEIEFFSSERVTVYTFQRNQKYRVYDLKKTDTGWKIIG